MVQVRVKIAWPTAHHAHQNLHATSALSITTFIQNQIHALSAIRGIILKLEARMVLENVSLAQMNAVPAMVNLY